MKIKKATTTSESWNIRRWTGFTHNSASPRFRSVCILTLFLSCTYSGIPSFLHQTVSLTLTLFFSLPSFSSPLSLSSLCSARRSFALYTASAGLLLRIVRVRVSECARSSSFTLPVSLSAAPPALVFGRVAFGPSSCWAHSLRGVLVMYAHSHTYMRVRTNTEALMCTHPYGLCH